VSIPKTEAGEPDCIIEISPLYAADAAQLKAKPLPFKTIERGQSIYLG